MSLLAASFDWGDPSPSLEEVALLLSALPERVTAGRRFCRIPHAILGFGGRPIRRREASEIQPFGDDQRQLYAVGDLRLDNRDDLRASLFDGKRALASDIAILVSAYERWGHETAERLVGDFAFVIWDGRRREVYAARDPFGVRTLVYRASSRKVIFASAPAQLLALPDTDRSPAPEIVVNFLSWNWSRYGPTFFASIKSVRPGHYLCAGEAGSRETEYFRPSATLLRYARAEDYEERFRELFGQSVRDRLDSNHPILAHLSGGLDSSSIVCVADRIYRDGGHQLPSFHTGSAVFPGQAYDESPYIDAVSRAVSFESHRWNGNLSSGREFSRPSLNIPGGSVATNSGSAGDLETAHALGARVVLSGDPGDFVTGEAGLFNQLLVRGQWLTLVGQLAAAGSRSERSARQTLLRRAMRDEVPRTVLQIARARHRFGPTVTTPSWLRSDLRQMWADPDFGVPPVGDGGGTRLQRGIWSYLRWSRVAWAVEGQSAYADDGGVEMRFPFLDARLVRFMLSIPHEHRLLGPTRRSFHRRSLAGILPDTIARRSSKAVFNGAVVRWGHANLDAIRDILGGAPWHSEQFVDQSVARAMLDRLAGRTPDPVDRKGWIHLRSIVNIETWLRAVFRYAPTKETLPMRDIHTKHEEPSGEDPGGLVQAPHYDAPRLTVVGNVRALLAAGAFTGDDNSSMGNQSADQPPG